MMPLGLIPAYKHYIWGGNRLKTLYNKNYDGSNAAESWELSCHPDGMSVIDSKFSPDTLLEYIQNSGWAENVGTDAPEENGFPVLVKLIDAKCDLSVQVHPNDEYAREHEQQNGKTELWYIAECEPDSFIYLGFTRELTRDELQKRIEEKTIEEVLRRVDVKKGDAYLIEAGTVHAIGSGCLVAEIQQSSNVTYRLWDYDRRDDDGKPRELHIEKALEVATLAPAKHIIAAGHIAKCKYFTVDRFLPNTKFETTSKSFCHLLCLEGEGTLNWSDGSMPIKKGSGIFIPAGDEKYRIKGRASGLLTSL